MERVEALQNIKESWNNPNIKLGEKILSISSDFYSSGLDVATTAAFIKATPVELDAFLSLGGLEDDIIELISEVNPPKTTWMMLANANDEEVRQALLALKEKHSQTSEENTHYTYSEFVYNKMLEISGPTKEDLVRNLAGSDLKHVWKKGVDFNLFTPWETKFLKNIAGQRSANKNLSDKQVTHLIKILEKSADNNVITRNSIDGDQMICNRILDALGR